MHRNRPREKGWTICAWFTIGAALFFGATYSGPYKWASEWQLRQWDKYYPKLSFVFTTVLLYVVVWSLSGRWLFCRFSREVPNSANPIDAYLAKQQAMITGSQSQPRQPMPWVLKCLLLFGLLGIVFGAFSLFLSWKAGPLTDININTLEVGGQPKSGWLRLTEATPVWELSIALIESETDQEGPAETYTPIVSENWETGESVSVFLYSRGNLNVDRLKSSETVVGTVAIDGLPGIVKNSLQNSATPPADNYIVLHSTMTPERRKTVGVFFLKYGSLLLAIWCVLFGVRYRFARHRPSRQ